MVLVAVEPDSEVWVHIETCLLTLPLRGTVGALFPSPLTALPRGSLRGPRPAGVPPSRVINYHAEWRITEEMNPQMGFIYRRYLHHSREAPRFFCLFLTWDEDVVIWMRTSPPAEPQRASSFTVYPWKFHFIYFIMSEAAISVSIHVAFKVFTP